MYLKENINNLVEDRKDEQPSDMITTRRYKPIPLSYRDKLQELGFKSSGSVIKWFKEYKGYCITVLERTNRQKLSVFLSERSTLKTDPTKGRKLIADEVYTEDQLVTKIKELESKIDTFRRDPYGRDEESIYEQMNKIDDSKSLDEKWNVKNHRELKKLKENFTIYQYTLDWDGDYEWADEESFNTKDEAQTRFNELKELIDAGEFDYSAIAMEDETGNTIATYGEPEGGPETERVTKEDLIEYLRSIEEISLTDQEFDYVVEDLWDAISREMREGSKYKTIDDVDMVELIDASDNPTHDLCYKLMGLLDEDEKLSGEDLRVAISEELPFLEGERGPNATLEDAIEFIIDHLLEARMIFDEDEVVKVVTELYDGING